jgi:hypothetical protein
VQRILPEVRMVAVTGSAAFEAAHFRPDSDIDVVAIGPRNAFAWGQASGRELEIRCYTLPGVVRMVQNPQWQTTNWLWVSGSIARAEVLWGESIEDVVRAQIDARTRLVAGSGLIGLLLQAQNRAKSGRRPVSLDVPLALTALRHIIRGVLPIRAEADEDFSDMSAASDLSGALGFAGQLARETNDILRDNNEMAKIMYVPANRTGLHWLRDAAGINKKLPDVCIYE